MSEIHFNNIKVQKGKIEMECKSVGDSLEIDEMLYFELSEEILVHDNQISVALATLCGEVYDKIFMDLTINQNILNDIKTFTQSDIQVNDIIFEDKVYEFSENNIMLGFSGGFDSLAAYYLLNDNKMFDNLYLTSLDLGGRFSREKDFFKRFMPYIVTTNIVDLKLNRNHWTFMYLPQILFSEYLNAKYITLSGILESGIYGLDEQFSLSTQINNIPISYLGMEIIQFIYGLTEIGTTIAILHHCPELIDLSLKSLANPGEVKRYRKQLMVDIVSKNLNKRVFYEPVDDGLKIEWGSHFTDDFICLYIIKHAGIEEASKIINNIPKEAVDFANSLSLNFYEKFNNNFLNVIPDEFKSQFLINLSEAEIYSYNSVDWKEYNKVAKFLSNYYEDLRKRLE